MYPAGLTESGVRDLIKAIAVSEAWSHNIDTVVVHPYWPRLLKWHASKQGGDEEAGSTRLRFQCILAFIISTVAVGGSINRKVKEGGVIKILCENYPDFEALVDRLVEVSNQFNCVNERDDDVFKLVDRHFWNLFNEVMDELNIASIDIVETHMLWATMLPGRSLQESLELGSKILEGIKDVPASPEIDYIRTQVARAAAFIRENLMYHQSMGEA